MSWIGVLLNKYVIGAVLVLGLLLGDFLYGCHVGRDRCEAVHNAADLKTAQAVLLKAAEDRKAAQADSDDLKIAAVKRAAVREAVTHEVKTRVLDDSACAIGLDVLRALDRAGGTAVQPGG